MVFGRKWGRREPWKAWERIAVEEEKVFELQGGCASGRGAEMGGAVAAGPGR